jgi:hypothetical protein
VPTAAPQQATVRAASRVTMSLQRVAAQEGSHEGVLAERIAKLSSN